MIDVQGLLAETIAHEQQLPAMNIPYGAGEHAHQVAKPLAHAPVVEGGEHDLGVGSAAETESTPLELPPKFLEVVDLAVKHSDVATRRRCHRLMAERRHVDDGQTPKSKRHSGMLVDPHALVVGPAMGDRPGHAIDVIAELPPRKARRAQDTCKSTHGRCA